MNNKMTFDEFMVDDTNRFAHAICKSVVSSLTENSKKEQSYNPVIIYGPSGCGKTHLLYAVYAATASKKACFVSAGEWADDLIAGYNKEDMRNYDNKYGNLDLLIVDNLDDLLGKKATQEAFAEFIESKVSTDYCFVIMASTRPFSDYAVLSTEFYKLLKNGFGVIADIMNPSVDFRRNIIRAMTEKMSVQLDEVCMDYLAEEYELTYNQLCGIMSRLAFDVSQSKHLISFDLLKEVLTTYAYKGGKKDED